MLGSLRQKSLHDCALRFEDRVFVGSVFPLFDDDGETQALMITSQSDADILVVDFEPTIFAGRSFMPRVWPQKINLPRAQLRDADLDVADVIADLWHFDPWWELGDERYSGHSLVPVLKATNVVGYDDSISAMWFNTSLQKAVYLGTGEGEQFKMKKFKPELLQQADAERRVAAAERSNRRAALLPGQKSSEWRLRPFWQ